ncbi:MAG: Calx-beta domain-containing protein [Bacteroidales bacterium]
MNNKFIFNLSLFLTMFIVFQACEKIEETRIFTPTASFEKAAATIKADAGTYNVKILLSKPLQKEVTIKCDFTGSAINGEHYTVDANTVIIPAGSSEASFNISILKDNIYDELLDIKCLLAPGRQYAIQPELNSEFKLNITKEIILPTLSFKSSEQNRFTNPFLEEIITYELNLTETLRVDTDIRLNIEGGLTIGADFSINGGNSNIITVQKGVKQKTFEVKFRKKDSAGFSQNLKFTLVPVTVKSCIVLAETSFANIKVIDPVVDFTSLLKSPALLGGAGFIMEQAIKAIDGTYAGKVALNMDKIASRANYLKTFRNMSYNTAFLCNSNSPGGDILRLAELLNFANTDTVIADYGVGKTTRYFSPSDSLVRFVADGENIRRGTVIAAPQKFTAKLVKKIDWETGTNGNKQWHIDSKLTNGLISQTTYSLIFDVIEINLVRLEGTFNMDDVIPSICFNAWFSSSSKYFMKNIPSTHNIVKEGNLYKLSYKFTPK